MCVEGDRTVCLGDACHLGVGVHFVEILLVALGGGLDGLVTGVPVRGANLSLVSVRYGLDTVGVKTYLAVLVGELEGIE